MMNVKLGRWKIICQPAQEIALGKYGRTPGPINPALLAQIEKSTGQKAITERPANLLQPGMEKYRKQCADKGLPTSDEIAVLYAMFPQQVEALLKPKAAEVPPPAPAPVAPAATNGHGRKLFITVSGHRHEVTVENFDN